MNEHTAKAFDIDLQDLARMVAEMGGLAEKQIADSVDALAKRDTALAQRVTVADASIDALQREIEEKAVLTIARAPADGGRSARHRRRAARWPTISSASATSPRTSPSG